MIVGEEIPGVARFAVVFAYGAPLPFAQVWSPLLPWAGSGAGFVEAAVLVGQHRFLIPFRVDDNNPFQRRPETQTYLMVRAFRASFRLHSRLVLGGDELIRPAPKMIVQYLLKRRLRRCLSIRRGDVMLTAPDARPRASS
jgi:hypothetical protein